MMMIIYEIMNNFAKDSLKISRKIKKKNTRRKMQTVLKIPLLLLSDLNRLFVKCWRETYICRKNMESGTPDQLDLKKSQRRRHDAAAHTSTYDLSRGILTLIFYLAMHLRLWAIGHLTSYAIYTHNQ